LHSPELSQLLDRNLPQRSCGGLLHRSPLLDRGRTRSLHRAGFLHRSLLHGRRLLSPAGLLHRSRRSLVRRGGLDRTLLDWSQGRLLSRGRLRDRDRVLCRRRCSLLHQGAWDRTRYRLPDRRLLCFGCVTKKLVRTRKARAASHRDITSLARFRYSSAPLDLGA
jgi:hypothetical protein